MPRTLILIKHAMPEIVESLPALYWKLGEPGREATRALAPRLHPYGIGQVVASNEPKAAETGTLLSQELTVPIELADGLHEHRRETVGWLERSAFEAGVRSLFETPERLAFGEETGTEATERFSSAVDEALARHSNVETLAIVTHGTVISIFCASRDERIDGFSLWRLLQLPAVVVLEAKSFRVREILGELT